VYLIGMLMGVLDYGLLLFDLGVEKLIAQDRVRGVDQKTVLPCPPPDGGHRAVRRCGGSAHPRRWLACSLHSPFPSFPPAAGHEPPECPSGGP